MADKSVNIRLSLKDGEVVKRALLSLGEEGQRALRRLEQGAVPASRGLRVLDTTVKELKTGVSNWAAEAGAAGRVLTAFGPGGLAAAAGIGATVIAGKKLIDWAKEAAGALDHLQDTADTLGVGPGFLQSIRFSAGQLGADIEKVDPALQHLNQVLGDVARGGGAAAQKAFERLGFTVTDSQGRVKTLEQALPQLADGFAKVSSAQERASLSQDLFGKGNQNFSRVLDQGSDALARNIALAHEMGAVIDDDIVRKGAQAHDQLEALSQVISAQLTVAIIDAVPAIVSLTKAFATAAKFAGELVDSWNAIDLQRVQTIQGTIAKLREDVASLNRQEGNAITQAGKLSWLNPFGGIDIDLSGVVQKRAAALTEIRRLEAELADRGRQTRQRTGAPEPGGVAIDERIDVEIQKLKEEQEQLRRTNLEREIYNNLKAAGVADRTSTAGQRIVAETTALFEAKRAEDARKQAEQDAAAATRKTTEDVDRKTEAYNQLVHSLKFETAQLKESERQQAINNALDKVSLDLTTERGREIARLAGIQFDAQAAEKARADAVEEAAKREQDATEAAAERAQEAIDIGRDSIKGLATGFNDALKSGEDFWQAFADAGVNALDRLQSKLLDFALDQALGKSGDQNFGFLGDLFAGLFKTALGAAAGAAPAGSLTYGGPRAGGGDARPGRLYKVGEEGEEWFVPEVAGTIVPHDIVERMSKSKTASSLPPTEGNSGFRLPISARGGSAAERPGWPDWTGDRGMERAGRPSIVNTVNNVSIRNESAPSAAHDAVRARMGQAAAAQAAKPAFNLIVNNHVSDVAEPVTSPPRDNGRGGYDVEIAMRRIARDELASRDGQNTMNGVYGVRPPPLRRAR